MEMKIKRRELLIVVVLAGAVVALVAGFFEPFSGRAATADAFRTDAGSAAGSLRPMTEQYRLSLKRLLHIQHRALKPRLPRPDRYEILPQLLAGFSDTHDLRS